MKSLIGGTLFLVYYAVFIVGLEWLAPGYIERVWNMAVLSRLFVFSIPIEEMLFAASFGYYWTGLYEYISWQKDNPAVPSAV